MDGFKTKDGRGSYHVNLDDPQWFIPTDLPFGLGCCNCGSYHQVHYSETKECFGFMLKMEEDKEETKRLQEYILSHPEEYPDNLLQTIAALRAQLKRVEGERDRLTMIAEEISKQATIEHYNIEDARKSLSVIQKRHALELAAKEAELVELQQCRDHWKISYEELRQWKESAMTVLSKIDLQAIGKEIGARLGCDISPEILPWIRDAKDKLSLYRRAVGPVREAWDKCKNYKSEDIVFKANEYEEAIEDCIRILDSGREEK